jgi:hypothetical protein
MEIVTIVQYVAIVRQASIMVRRVAMAARASFDEVLGKITHTHAGNWRLYLFLLFLTNQFFNYLNANIFWCFFPMVNVCEYCQEMFCEEF